MIIKEKLFDGRLDIVGDIHGEIGALDVLLDKLGYADDGSHSDGRRLVFVGDLIDRGPDSPAVVEKVMRLVKSGKAQCVLGNHELNILREKSNSDNAWFFTESDHDCSMMNPASPEQGREFLKFFKQLPVVLERGDLRVVHATWNADSLAELERYDGDDRSMKRIYSHYREITDIGLEALGHLVADYEREKSEYGNKIHYGDNKPEEHWPDPEMLPAHAIVDEKQQMGNPVAVLTSGEEREAQSPYPAGGKFRFVDRRPWWNDYRDDKAVVIGHYWRAIDRRGLENLRESGKDIFKGIGADEWLGPKRNVFCIDYCVGARALARKKGASCEGLKLGALRWPERVLVFDNRKNVVATRATVDPMKEENFMDNGHKTGHKAQSKTSQPNYQERNKRLSAIHAERVKALNRGVMKFYREMNEMSRPIKK